MALEELQGGSALCAWFGGTPTVHGAQTSGLELRQDDTSTLAAHIFNMTSRLDDRGYVILTSHAIVTLTMFSFLEVELRDMLEAGIMDGLDVRVTADDVELEFGSSYGVHGRIRAKTTVVSFVPARVRRPRQGSRHDPRGHRAARDTSASRRGSPTT